MKIARTIPAAAAQTEGRIQPRAGGSIHLRGAGAVSFAEPPAGPVEVRFGIARQGRPLLLEVSQVGADSSRTVLDTLVVPALDRDDLAAGRAVELGVALAGSTPRQVDLVQLGAPDDQQELVVLEPYWFFEERGP